MSKVEVILQGAKQTGLKEKDHWCTPDYILKKVKKFYGGSYFDPWPSNPTFDSFVVKWKKKVYSNPPFSIYLQCIKRGVSQLEEGSEQIWMCHHNHDVQWFQILRDSAAVECMLYDRVKFIDPQTGKPKSTAIGKCQSLFYMGDRVKEFCETFSDIGYCVDLRNSKWWE